jgi:hypothetical protein
MVENKYWFARRFPLTDPRNSMSPVTPEGYRVAWTFVGWMAGGAIAAAVILVIALLWMPLLGVLAPVIFIGCAIYGAWYFITQARDRGDHQHTVDDYKQGRL